MKTRNRGERNMRTKNKGIRKMENGKKSDMVNPFSILPFPFSFLSCSKTPAEPTTPQRPQIEVTEDITGEPVWEMGLSV